MTQWTRRILRRRNGKGTVTDTEDGSDMKATKLMDFIEASAPNQAKKGVTIRFMHDLGKGTVYWLEGEIEERHEIQESSEVEIRRKFLPDRQT